MTKNKEKILLRETQETLLVPLYARAVTSRQSNSIFVDPKAVEILENIDYDFTKLEIPFKTVVTLCIRAQKIDTVAREFLASHPQSVVIYLGCGLDSRCTRVNDGGAEWYDLDFPAVIELRRKFYQDSGTYHMIPSSVMDFGWADGIAPKGRPVLVIAEGLLMYLKEEEVIALILKLKAAFPGCELVFDAYSTWTAQNAKKHPSIKKTGAVIHWGIDDAAAIERWADGIRLKEEWYFTQAEEIQRLGLGYRLAFWLAGLFTAVNKAHRILIYTL